MGAIYVPEVRRWYNDTEDERIEQIMSNGKFENDVQAHSYIMLTKYSRKNVSKEFKRLFAYYEEKYRKVALKDPLHMLIYNYLLDIFNMAYKTVRTYHLSIDEFIELIHEGILSIARLFYKFGNTEYMIEALIRREIKWNMNNYVSKILEKEIFAPDEERTDAMDDMVIRYRPSRKKKRNNREATKLQELSTLKYNKSYKTVEGWQPRLIRLFYFEDGEIKQINLYFPEQT